jgi:hypothetical protein
LLLVTLDKPATLGLICSITGCNKRSRVVGNRRCIGPKSRGTLKEKWLPIDKFTKIISPRQRDFMVKFKIYSSAVLVSRNSGGKMWQRGRILRKKKWE